MLWCTAFLLKIHSMWEGWGNLPIPLLVKELCTGKPSAFDISSVSLSLLQCCLLSLTSSPPKQVRYHVVMITVMSGRMFVSTCIYSSVNLVSYLSCSIVISCKMVYIPCATLRNCCDQSI